MHGKTTIKHAVNSCYLFCVFSGRDKYLNVFECQVALCSVIREDYLFS
jgi:hypothetical protein